MIPSCRMLRIPCGICLQASWLLYALLVVSEGLVYRCQAFSKQDELAKTLKALLCWWSVALATLGPRKVKVSVASMMLTRIQA